MQSSLVNNGRGGGNFLVEIVKHQNPKPFSFSKSLTTSLPSPFLKLKTPHFFKPTTVTAPLHYLPCTASSDNNIGSTSDGSDGGEKSIGKWIEMVGEVLSTAFPVWVALGCFFGLVRPNSFNWVQPQMTIFGITITMLGMGMTLTFDDLRDALAMPKELLAGFLLQYSVMPLSGYFVSKLLKLPSYYAAGLILVGCCPGGTASNIVTYLARYWKRGPFSLDDGCKYLSGCGNDTTPFTSHVVLLPVLFGALLNKYCQGLVKVVSPVMPPIAVFTVALLCGNAIARNASAVLMSGRQVVLAVCLLHASGFFFGYVLSRLLRIDVSSSRTISIEVGMQNSVLGLVLAAQHFGDPLTAVPCAVSSVCHSIFGSLLAGIWRCNLPTEKQD
ncbi:hypothetical protein IFM89_028665 [Coptis chinensis]|uniref:Uncharacterized protein n=1 Tax=Coptis chinensis TaxID=261450 RepID=A0A835GY84_9MAGN|nr:hypothetical protein IFM89_028665 [Coptis chinensis]